MAQHPSDRLSEDRKARLFALAGEEFARRGFKQASLNRIITATGMSKSSFYHFFENKTDLYRQTIRRATRPYLEQFAAFDPESLSATTFWPVLRQFSEAMSRQTDETPELVNVGRMIYRSLDAPEEHALIGDFTKGTTLWLGALVRRGQVLGVVRDDLPETLLIDIILSLGMTIDRWMLAQWDNLPERDRHGLATAAVDLAERLCRP